MPLTETSLRMLSDEDSRGGDEGGLRRRGHLEVVICRYTEDISWMKEFPLNDTTYTIYNKGEPLDPATVGANGEVVMLANGD